MTDVVRERWVEMTEPLEGGVSCLYNDIRGIPTIAYGNAVFTPSEAAALDLRHADGTPATAAEKVAAWHTVKNDPNAARLGWRHAAKLTSLRLTRDGMAAMALAKYDANGRTLRARCPDWDTLPACARMGLHSLAWACGANAHYPRLFEAVNARDFARYEKRVIDGIPVEVVVGGAAFEIHMNEITPEGLKNTGLVPRNVANKLLMRNAGRVDSFKLDPDYLNWTSLVGVDEAPTQPELPMYDLTKDSEPPPSTAPEGSYARALERLASLAGNTSSSPTIHPFPDTVGEAQRRDEE